MRTDHLFLETMRQAGDAEADDLVRFLFARELQNELYKFIGLEKSAIEKLNITPPLRDFLLRDISVPSWFDPDRLLNGQRFFRKHALDIMTLLGSLSLPFCYAASPGNKAIYFTGKMRKTPGKRLWETAHFIISVMEEGSFESGNGSFEIARTRLIHALVRYHIRAHNAWDMQWGLPVNQEDMAGTNLAFSYIIIRGLESSGVRMSSREKEDFLHAWRFIGYGLNIDDDLLPASMAEAALLEEAIRHRHFRLSEEARLLTRELLTHYQESFPAFAGYLVESQIRYLTGPEVSHLLGLRSYPARDALIAALNFVRKQLNRCFVNPFSYDIMIRNHLKLKARYSKV